MAEKKSERQQLLILLGAGFAALALYGAGCSRPDRTFVDDTAGSGSSDGGTAAGGGSASGGRPGGGTSNGGTSSGGGATAGDAGQAGEGAGGQPGLDRPTPTKGLIVIGGTAIEKTQGVISVIEPATGNELSKELLPTKAQVAGIAYDGGDKKDVWYVLVGGTFPAAEDKVVELQVRYFDDKTNKWITLSKASTLPPPVPGTLTVLNDRLAYISHTVVSQVVTPTLTLLDTSNVLSVKQVTYTASNETGAMITLIGTRGTALDPVGVGGTLDLGFAENCGAGNVGCQLHVLPISVGDSIVNGVASQIGTTYKGTPISASNQLKQQANFVLADPNNSVSVYYTDPDAPEGSNHFPAAQAVTDMSALTIAECQNMAIFTASSENALYGIRFSNGAGKTLDLGRAGQLVAYEPFTRNIIATYNPPTDDFKTDAGVPGPEITAVTVVAPLQGSVITMTVRDTDWAPPTDVRTNAIATRFPVSFKCP